MPDIVYRLKLLNPMLSTMNPNDRQVDAKPSYPDMMAPVSGSEPPSGFILKLYQMVNGAPDDVISWTSSGDAFVIGADIKRLEEETLPQYFRHNRFQSLVRQLNFYSFRKINKERNVWIYKHHLFRRDSPEDLRLVRRRTCPGLDGRKQRFSRVIEKKQMSTVKALSIKSDEDSYCDGSTSSMASVGDEYGSSSTESLKEHDNVYGVSDTTSPALVLARLSESEVIITPGDTILPVSISSDTLENDNKSIVDLVDSSVVEPDVLCISDESQTLGRVDSRFSTRAERSKQTSIVSEVAMKLDEYAKKAMYLRGSYRTRRGVCGVVTPPSSLSSSRGLITYDDEPSFDYDDDLDTLPCPISKTFGQTKGNHSESLHKILATNSSVTSTKPVADRFTVDAIVQRIMRCQVEKTFDATLAIANVAGFCMSILPDQDRDVRDKIIHFTSSCEPVAAEFRQYRSALHPVPLNDSNPAYTLFGDDGSETEKFRRDGDISTQSEVVKEFAVFAVNCIHKVLSKSHNTDMMVDGVTSMVLHPSDFAVLQRTAEIWQRSVAINCHLARRL